MFGIVVIDKPTGITSHGVISALRKRFNTRRIGHAGTLDPLATGLLVVAVGPATRFLQYLNLEPKIYLAEITFGTQTTTYDSDGEVTENAPVPADLQDGIRAQLPGFHGRITQVPPAYSAIKHQGKPLYAYARRGESVELRSRTIFVEKFDLINLTGHCADFEIICSGGTYVRSLAHDLGRAIGCPAHISALRRTGAGGFRIEDAIPLDEVAERDIVPLGKVLDHLPQITLTEVQVNQIQNGQFISSGQELGQEPIGLFDRAGNVIGIGRVLADDPNRRIKPECVIPTGAILNA